MKKSQLRRIILEEFEKMNGDMDKEDAIAQTMSDPSDEMPKLDAEDYDDENEDGGEDEPESEEVDSLKSNLDFILQQAQGCVDLLQKSPPDSMDSWVESHIAAAKELVAHVAEYLGYEETDGDEVEDDDEDVEDIDDDEIDGDDSDGEYVDDEESEDDSPKRPPVPMSRKKIAPPANLKNMNEAVSPDQLRDAKQNYLKLKKQDLEQQMDSMETLDEKKKRSNKKIGIPKSEANYIKGIAKTMDVNGEQEDILNLIKKLEQYVKSNGCNNK